MAKAFTAYVDDVPGWWESSLEDYAVRPAIAFLRESVHISDAVNQCRRLFKRRADKSLNKDSQDSMYRLGAAALSSMMGHYETYQRSLFAGMIETTRFLPDFDIAKCCSRLEKDSALAIDLARIAAYRGQPTPIGQLMADNLVGWHDPDRVNSHFKAIVPDFQFISNADSEELRVLWQLRHAVVHTGGWLSRPDSQKLSALTDLADRPILLNENFVSAAARRLHPIVKRSTTGIRKRFVAKLPADLKAEDRKVVQELFRVRSPRQAWLG